MKKFKVFVLAVAMMLTFNALPISAQENLPNTLVKATLTDKSTGEQLDVKVIPLIQKSIYGEQMSDSYAVNVALPIEGMSRANGSSSSSEKDGYYSVTGKVTIYYDRSYDSHENDAYKLTKVSGSWIVHDSSVKVSNRHVSWQCSSYSPRVHQQGSKRPTGNSFSYKTGFTKYIGKYDMDAWVGATSLIDISKAARKWDLQVTIDKVKNKTI